MFISYARIVLIGNINTYVFNKNQKVPREDSLLTSSLINR
jgi:hypothetical protein